MEVNFFSGYSAIYAKGQNGGYDNKDGADSPDVNTGLPSKLKKLLNTASLLSTSVRWFYAWHKIPH